MTKKQNSVINNLQKNQKEILHKMLDQPSRLIQQLQEDQEKQMPNLVKNSLEQANDVLQQLQDKTKQLPDLMKTPLQKANEVLQQLQEDEKKKMTMISEQQAKKEEDKEFFKKL